MKKLNNSYAASDVKTLIWNDATVVFNQQTYRVREKENDIKAFIEKNKNVIYSFSKLR